ncbi:MAG: UDP-N-acetylmuramoyl-L-alanyl-D-glutamate--2,6-diaminopimelate ligase [Bacteroidales bacterium]|jgi:UDP-N-acetylmuramoyl-L-alanyl-D-glutamate--2,6-diaminopimelate ligase|nr:UDP-N-acetylmuramoyl-L-alanyl-D-glutamate--2,6-diaminopimelate ligase [Bacteroidales bacterium]
MKELTEILKDVQVLELRGGSSIAISALTLNSRKAENGSLFFAVKGTEADGHLFINNAIENGAVAIVCEQIPAANTDTNITYIKVKNSAEAAGKIASAFYGYPSDKLQLVGITGTNGKTTIATSLHNLFGILGHKTGLLSTIENRIGNDVIPSTHTTPDAIELNALLARMVESGCAYCFMEVSSHSVVQKRIAGLQFKGGVFTNITRDHLDYHKTFAEYLKAKKTFFDNLPSETQGAFALTNKDDKNGEVMLEGTRAKKYTYSVKELADFKGEILENTFDGLLLKLDKTEVATMFIGSFNAYNLTAIYAVATLLKQEKADVLKAISMLKPAVGRFEIITGKGINAIVDYAHTPNALENVLATLNEIRRHSQKIITITGAGGNRDKGKRPEMASIAFENSDKLILTSDNPRNEKSESIINDMLQGLTPQQQKETLVITDRREAIKTACAIAAKEDIILVSGKGHEKYQEINGIKHHFDDREILKNILESLS